MKSSDVLALVRAGYTRQEIEAMDAGDQAPAAPADPAPHQSPANPPQPSPAPAQPATPAQPAIPAAPAPMSDDAKQILANLGNLLKGVAVPQDVSIDERMANTLRMALGAKEQQ